MYGALALGYDVIFSDVDIAILQDPIRYLFLPNIHYTHTSNNGCGMKWNFGDVMEGNTGFYAVKSTPETIRTWDLTYRLCSRSPKYDDQTMFWLILRTNLNPTPMPYAKCPRPDKAVGGLPAVIPAPSSNTIVTCPLDSCMFSSGNLRDSANSMKLVDRLNSAKDRAVTVHANWLSGKEAKKQALGRSKLWIARRAGNFLSREESAVGRLKPMSGNWTCVEPAGPLFK